MRILLVEFGSSDREKARRLEQLTSLLRGRTEMELGILCREGALLDSLSRGWKTPRFVLPQSASGRTLTWARLFWKLYTGKHPWILYCCDLEALTLILQLIKKKKRFHLIYAPLLPEVPSSQEVEKKFPLVDAVIVPSQYAAKKLADLGFSEDRLHVAHTCLDPAGYLPRRIQERKKFIFVCSDSLEPGKGYEQLLQALSLLPHQDESLPPWELRIAGGGSLFESLLDQAHSLNVAGRMAVFGPDHGADILQDGDLIIVPAEIGQDSSLALQEGWASRLPVLCSDIPPHLELICDGQNGLCFKSGDSAHLAAQMRLLIQDNGLRRHLAQGGQESLGAYTGRRLLETHLTIFHQIQSETL